MQRELRKLQNLGGIGYALPYCMCGTFKMINEIVKSVEGWSEVQTSLYIPAYAKGGLDS